MCFFQRVFFSPSGVGSRLFVFKTLSMERIVFWFRFFIVLAPGLSFNRVIEMLKKQREQSSWKQGRRGIIYPRIVYVLKKSD